MRSIEARNEINCSVPTLLSPLTVPLLGLPMEGLVRFSRIVGYNGLEWRPLGGEVNIKGLKFSPLKGIAERQISAGMLSNYAIEGIHSAEQSYVGERTWKDASNHSNKRLAQISFILFPHRQDSLDSLVKLQKQVGDIPITIYPTTDPQEQEMQIALRNKIVQLAPDCIQAWNCHSFDELFANVQDQGYGINFDLLHYLRLGKHFPLPPAREAIALMRPLIKEVQFPVGRIDFPTPNGDSMDTYADLLNGRQDSVVTQLLTTLLEAGYQGPIVPEINPMAFGKSLLKAHLNTTRGLKSLVA